jgi:hypothetical protein
MANGLLDSVLGDFAPQTSMPDRKIIPIDPQTNQLIDEGIKRARQTPEQIAAQRLQGVDTAAKGAQQSDQQASSTTSLFGYSSPGMNQAIRNQYNSQAGMRLTD